MRNFTEEENQLLDRIKQLHGEGGSAVSIGKELGKNPRLVARWFRMLGLPTRSPRFKRLEIKDGEGKCFGCGKWKSLDDFEDTKSGGKLCTCFACRYLRDKNNKNRDNARYLKARYVKLRSRCLKEGIDFNLSFQDMIDLYESNGGRCFYTDIPMELEIGLGPNRNTLSFDRILPDKGYIAGNVVLCLARINAVKNNLTLDEMRQWMPSFYERLRKAGYVR